LLIAGSRFAERPCNQSNNSGGRYAVPVPEPAPAAQRRHRSRQRGNMCCCSSIMNGAAADDSVRHHVPGHQLRHIVALATALIVISRPMTLPTRRSFSPMDWHRSPAPTSSSQRRKILRNADKEFVFGTPVWNQPADRKFSLCQIGRACTAQANVAGQSRLGRGMSKKGRMFGLQDASARLTARSACATSTTNRRLSTGELIHDLTCR